MDFGQIVDFKWSQDAWLSYAKTLLQMLHIVLLNIDIIYIKADKFTNVTWLTNIVISFNAFFLIW